MLQPERRKPLSAPLTEGFPGVNAADKKDSTDETSMAEWLAANLLFGLLVLSSVGIISAGLYITGGLIFWSFLYFFS